MQEHNLLVIEDDIRISDLICNIAQKSGFIPHAALGIAALKTACGNMRIDVVVLDIIMPDMDGIEVLQFLNQGFYRPRLIIMSGSDEVARRITGNLATALGFNIEANIKKPFDIKGMFSLFKKLKADLDT